MSQINRLGSTRVTLRNKANISQDDQENALPGFHGKKTIFSKRKASFSPAKLKGKIMKRPVLIDSTNDVKMRKVKSIIKNDKPLKVVEKCAEKEEDAPNVKSSRAVSEVRAVSGVRLPPFQSHNIHNGTVKIKNNAATSKVAATKTKPASKSAVQQTKPCTKPRTVQTLLTVHVGNGHLRRSSRLQNENSTSKKESTTRKDCLMKTDSRLQNENETSKKESTTKKDSSMKMDSRLQNENETSKKESTTKKDSSVKMDSRLQHENKTLKKELTTEKDGKNDSTATELLLDRRRSLRSQDSVPKEVREPTGVIDKIVNLNEAIAEDRVKPTRRSSARLSLRKSSTVDKSSESNSLYVSALEEITIRDKKYNGEELTEFDKELVHDPHQVALYAGDIFVYLKLREGHFPISDYMSRLSDITQDMRTILVDWMVEVQENFELNHETLYLSVKIVDAYLDKITEIKRDKLQLVGVTAMFVACKYDERLSPLLEDFVYVCDGAYDPKDILAMEQQLLDTLNYELSFPISYSFLRRYARCARVPMPLLTLARYILELSLIDYRTVTLSDSKQAAAALYLAFRMVKHSDWTESLVFYSGYKLEEFHDIVFLFNSILHKKFPEEVKAVRTKYSHEIFFEVSRTRLLSDEELKIDMAENS